MFMAVFHPGIAKVKKSAENGDFGHFSGISELWIKHKLEYQFQLSAPVLYFRSNIKYTLHKII
jgi:hypothetical protein